jgi:hypothetical protein
VASAVRSVGPRAGHRLRGWTAPRNFRCSRPSGSNGFGAGCRHTHGVCAHGFPSVAGATASPSPRPPRWCHGGERRALPAHRKSAPGVARPTSMFQSGENDRCMANDWRLEIHDSDGLAMWTGSDEWIWRPWSIRRTCVSTLISTNPRGFGLLQLRPQLRPLPGRSRVLRPPTEPWSNLKSGWGKGSGNSWRSDGR